MQRIDENTYIDDSLVTCAEYQLFIDEMREQGKYYQPDHWTSYQFPNGQAREPILGVRHSDAKAFCEWLTHREEIEWKFRLPIEKEAVSLPIRPLNKNPLGFWLNTKNKFAWIGYIPENTRALTLAFDHDLDLIGVSTRRQTLASILVHALDSDVTHTLDRDRGRDLARSLASDLNRDLDRGRNLVHALKLSRDLDQKFLLLNLDRGFDLHMDILTLQERIAGRSPAFEGIRLVKERIR